MKQIRRSCCARLLVVGGSLLAFVTAAPAAEQGTGTMQQREQKPAATQAAVQQTFSQDELDGLLAPIALYPDGLLTPVLTASTYPVEVVAADRFVASNPNLRGEALDEALAKKNWDPSVQSLAAYPKVLAMMSEKIEWTARLSNAVLEDQGRVMDTVQSLRRRAEAAGNLESTSEKTVVHDKQTIVIEPTQTEVVYVPYYDWGSIYGWSTDSVNYGYYYRYYGSSYSVSVSYSEKYSISRNHWSSARMDWKERRFNPSSQGNRLSGRTGLDPAASRPTPLDAASHGTRPLADRAMQGPPPMAGGGPPSMGSFGGFPGGGPPPFPGPPPGPPGPH